MEVQVGSYDDYVAKRDDPAKRVPLHGEKPKRLSWLYFLTGNASVTRADLDRVGRFDEEFTGYGHEDLELGYRLQHGGVPLEYEPRAVNYHWHPVPWDEQQQKYELAGRSTVRFYRKHPAWDVKLRLGMTPVSLALHDVVRQRAAAALVDRARCREARLRAHALVPVPLPDRRQGSVAWIAPPRRTGCGGASAALEGAAVELAGWVHRRRDHGGLIFIDLRDRDGITQITFDPSNAATFAEAETLRSEDVVRVRGVVRRRPAGTENPRLATGEVEVPADELEILNRSETPPFVIASEEEPAEDVRLRYRYLDLRRPRMQRNLAMRHAIVKAIRDYFDEHGFLEIETPNLIKSTPEGARDYLVPSRVHRGAFYALPQSPQILKQILMIGGLGPLHADRALLPRRGPARGPSARVHAGRRRDDLRAARRRRRDDGRRDALRVAARARRRRCPTRCRA